MLLPFLKLGHCKVRSESKSQAKAQECFYLGPAPSHPRDAVRVPTKHRTLLTKRHVTWQRESPAPSVPAQMHDSLSQEEEGSETDDESTPSRGVRGVMDERDEGLDRLTDLDVTWGFDLPAFLRERSQETPAAGDASDETVETMESSKGGTMDASSVPAGRAETVETMDCLKGARWTPPRSRQGGPKQSRRWINLKGVRWTPPWCRQGGSKAT